VALGVLFQAASQGSVRALPIGGEVAQVTAGGTINQTLDSGTLTVTSDARRGVINWNSFDVAATETVRFTLPDSASIIVNRVTGCLSACSVSFIDGHLLSNGNVWVINSNGIVFGPNAIVSVAGLLATTADLNNEDGFVSATDNAAITFSQPIRVAGAAASGTYPIGVMPGAKVVVNGGFAAFIAGGQLGAGTVTIGGSVTEGGTADQLANSQVLYGAANSFILHLGHANALSSTDLQLFDYQVDYSSADTSQIPAVVTPYDAITISAGSTTQAGQILIDADLPDELAYGPQVNISGSMAATGGDRPSLSSLSPGELDLSSAISIQAGATGSVHFLRGATYVSDTLIPSTLTEYVGSTGTATGSTGTATGSTGTATGSTGTATGGTSSTGVLTMEPLVVLSSGGSIKINAYSIDAYKISEISSINGPMTVDPNYEIVQFITKNGNFIANKISMNDSDLKNIDISANIVEIYDQFIDINIGNVVAGNYLRMDAVGHSIFAGDIKSSGSGATIVASGADAGQGQISLGNVSSNGQFSLAASQSVMIGDIVSATNVKMYNATGTFTTGDIRAVSGYVSIQPGGGLTTGAIDFAQELFLNAYSYVHIGNVSSENGTFFINAFDNITVGDIVDNVDNIYLKSTSHVSIGNVLNNTGSLSIYSLSGISTENITIGGANINLNSQNANIQTGNLSAGYGSVYLQAQGQIHSGNVLGGLGVQIQSLDDKVVVGSLDGGIGGASLNAAQGLTAGNVTTSRAINLFTYSGDLTAGSLQSNFITVATQAGNVQLGNILSEDTASSESGAFIFARSADIGHGQISIGNVNISGQFSLGADRSASVGNIVARSNIGLQSNAGILTVGDVSSQSGFVSIIAADGLSVGKINVADSLYFSSLGYAHIGNITSDTGSASIYATEDISVGNVSVGGANIDLNSQNANIQAGNLSAKYGSVYLQAQGQIHLGNVLGGLGVQMHSLGDKVITGSIGGGSGGVLVGAALGLVTTDVTTLKDIDLYTSAGELTAGSLQGDSIKLNTKAGNITINNATGHLLRMADYGGSVLVNGEVNIGPTDTPPGTEVLSPGIGIVSSGDVQFSRVVNSVRDIVIDASGTVIIDQGMHVANGFGSQQIDGPGISYLYGGIDIRAGDLRVSGPMTVGGLGGINIAAKGAGGVRLGDFASNTDAGTFSLSAAELGYMTADTVWIRSSLDSGSSSNLQIGDLGLSANKIGTLGLATGSNGRLQILGKVISIGAPGLIIGDFGNALGGKALVPGSVEITGALGTLAAPIGTLQINSGGDILIGSEKFVTSVRASSDKLSLDLGSFELGYGGVATDQIFLSSGVTQLRANGVILQQTTSATGEGVRFQIGSGLVFGSDAQALRVALFGGITNADGSAILGQGVAQLSGFLPTSATQSTAVTFNDCQIGVTKACVTPRIQIDLVTSVVAAVSSSVSVSSSMFETSAPSSYVAPTDTGASTTTASSGGAASEGSSEATPAESKNSSSSSSSKTAAGEPTSSGSQKIKAAKDDPVPVEAAQPESRAGPIVVDASARDLLTPESGRLDRQPGVGTSNEDLWPEGH